MGDSTKSLAEDKGDKQALLPLISPARMIIQISEQCNCKETFGSLFSGLHILLTDVMAMV